MAVKTSNTRSEQDAAYNPAKGLDDDVRRGLASLEADANRDSIDKSLQDIENYANDPTGSADKLKEKEESGDEKPADSRFVNNFTGANRGKQKATLIGKLGKNKKLTGAVFGVGGIGGLLIAAFFALMPLKLTALVENITGHASAIASYPIERRAEYLMTRLIAHHVIKTSLPDGDIAFCRTAGVACTLTKTFTAKYFEDKMGLTMSRNNDGSVRIVAGDRNSIGGAAREWTITNTIVGDGDIDALTRTIIDGNSAEDIRDMKLFIKDHVNKNLPMHGYATRYLVRKLLMNKYGIRNWAGMARATDSITDMRARINSKIVANTIGKILPKFSLYMACVNPGQTCSRIKDRLGGGNAPEGMRQLIDDINTNGSSLGSDIGRLVSRRIMAVAGAVGIASIADMGFKAIGSVDEGKLDEIVNDIKQTAYIGFAYGDEVGVVVNSEKVKAGDIDLEVLGELTKMFDDVENSALMQAENGLSVPDNVTQECASQSDESGYAPLVLEAGQLVCPENRFNQGIANFDSPAWDSIAAVADAWNDSAGLIFDVVNEGISNVFAFLVESFPPLQSALNWTGERLQGALEWMFRLVFDIPNVGPGASGAQNYAGLSAGIRTSQNELMFNGVNTADGSLYGAGGSVLSNSDIAALTDEYLQSEQQEFEQQSFIAKMFNPYLKGSAAQKLALSVSPNTPSIFSFVGSSFRNLLTPTTSAQTTISSNPNPFNQVLYGYGASSSAYGADPELYTPDYCTDSAEIREDSYEKIDAFPVAVYREADPCALERTVVGALLASEGVADDEYSYTPVGETGATENDDAQEDPVNPTSASWVSPIPAGQAYTVTQRYANPTNWGPHPGSDFFYRGDFVSICDGTVVKIDNNIEARVPGRPELSNQLAVDCGGGIIARYHHYYFRTVKSGIRVGARVEAGTPLAEVGNQGNTSGVTGIHLHFEIRTDSANHDGHTGTRDPVAFLRTKGVSL